MKLNQLFNVIIVAAFGFASTAAYSSHHEEGNKASKKQKRGEFMKCFKQEFSPSEEQIKQIQAIMKDRRSKRRGHRADRRKARELTEKLGEDLKGTASSKQLAKRFEDIQKLHNSHRYKKFEGLLAIRDVLTPEQRKNFGKCKGPMSLRLHGGKDSKRGK